MPDVPKFVKKLSNPFLKSRAHSIPSPVIEEKVQVVNSVSSAGDDALNFDPKSYTAVGKLGKGCFGRVDLVRSGDGLFALKQQKTNKTCFGDEIDVHLKISKNGDHPNIAKLYYASGNHNKTGLIAMEYCTGCSLGTLATYLTEGQLRVVAREVLEALSFLESIKVIHRDLKPDNIIIGRNGEVKIIDLGIAVDTEKNTPNIPTGSLLYMAPEQITCFERSFVYSTKIDVWALGITILELATGRIPHADLSRSQIVTAISRGDAPSLAKLQREAKSSTHYSNEFHDFMTQCLKRDPENRSRASELKNHSWLLQKSDPSDKEGLAALVARLGKQNKKLAIRETH